MGAFDEDIEDIQRFMDGERFSATTRVYAARQVAEQKGTVPHLRVRAEKCGEIGDWRVIEHMLRARPGAGHQASFPTTKPREEA